MNIQEMLDMKPENEEQAKALISGLLQVHNLIEDKLAEVGVEFQIPVYLGEYGYGRSLALEDYEGGWSPSHEAGDWISSSANC